MRRIAVGVALLLAACQAGPAPRAPKAIALSPGERLRTEGEAFFAKADYVDTLDLFHTMEAYFTWYPNGAPAA